MAKPTAEERFWSKIKKTPTCWVWVGARIPDGYGSLGWDGRVRLAHRVSLHIHNGEPVPDDMTVDHLCRNRACVNPDHLEVVTMRENVRRGIGPTAINGRKTHCIHGHPLSGENVRVRSDGGRRCVACQQAIESRRVRPGR